MRILLISHLDLNILLFRRALVQALAAAGHECLVAVPPTPRAGEIEALGARVATYRLARGSLNPLTLPAAVRDLRDLFGRERPDLIHSFTHQPNIFGRLARPRDIPLVNSVTGLGSCFLGQGVKALALRQLFTTLYRTTAHRADCVVFQNEDDHAHFRDHGMLGRARTAYVRGSGVDTGRFRPDRLTPEERAARRAELGLGPDDVVVTLTARLLFDKGVREFLEAAALLAPKRPEARFLVVGETDPGNPRSLDEADIQAARRAGHAVFAGWRTDMDVVWGVSDVAVLPSYREGLPVSLQEALACGLPAVTTDVPGCRAIAQAPSADPEGVCEAPHCHTVPVRDAAALAEALDALITDPDLRRAMGRAARAKAVADFDAARLAQAHLSLYGELLHGA